MLHTYVVLNDAMTLLLARLKTHCGTKDLTILITDPSYVYRSMEDNGKPLSIGTCFPLVLNFAIAIAASMLEAISSATKKNVLLHYPDFGIYCPLAKNVPRLLLPIKSPHDNLLRNTRVACAGLEDDDSAHCRSHGQAGYRRNCPSGGAEAQQ